tara:strand:- start:1540 stop:1869 length:330 start_codon:yes stop_codon:yes gene_type:complete
MTDVENFSDLKFNPFHDGISSRVAYGDYELSTVRHSGSYGNQEGLYEIGIFKNRGGDLNNMVEIAGVTEKGDTVKGFLTEEDVTEIMGIMVKISGTDGVQEEEEEGIEL